MKSLLFVITGLFIPDSSICLAVGAHQLDRKPKYTHQSPPEDDRQRLIYQDNLCKMVAIGYGSTTHPSKPGFYIFRKKTKDWIRLDKVSTAGATFGRSPTFQEAKKMGKIPASIGWDFTSLAQKAYVDLPLKSGGILFFPDKVESREAKYLLYFNSSWQIKGVQTILKVPIEHLTQKAPE